MKISQRAQRERLRKIYGRGPINLHHFYFYASLAREAIDKYKAGDVRSDWTEYGFTHIEISQIIDFFGILNNFEMTVAINYYRDCGLLEKRRELYHMTRFGIAWYNSLCERHK